VDNSPGEARGRSRTPVWVWFAVGNSLLAIAILVIVAPWNRNKDPQQPPAAGQGVAGGVANPGANDPANIAPGGASVASPAAAPAPGSNLTPVAAADRTSTLPQESKEASGSTVAAPSTIPQSTAALAPRTAAEIVEAVDRGVVQLTMFDLAGDEIGFGSGFVVDASGLVATNFHVLGSASSAQATLRDGSKLGIAGCCAYDADADLAVLQLTNPPDNLEVLPLATWGEPHLAADVIAIGHPQGFKFTATTGIISAVHTTAELPRPYRQFLNAPDNQVWIQTNAAISGGNSGGPLLNMQGAVVGINTWVASGENLGFACDVRHLAELLAKERAEGAINLAALTGPAERVQVLIAEFSSQYGWFQQRLEQADTPAEKEEIRQKDHPSTRIATELLVMAEACRRAPAQFDALSALLQVVSVPGCPRDACAAATERATALLLEDQLASPRLGELALKLRASTDESIWKFLRAVIAGSPNRQVQAVGRYCLAMALAQAGGGDSARDAEVKLLIDELQRSYADVVVGQTPLAEAAEQQLFELLNLGIGRTAPDIVGLDQDRQEFKLSEYRGKVVVLDFWADWCPHCVDMYPHERALTEKLADQPFAILGINCDEPDRFRRVLERKDVTWRNWHDGPGGSICQQYRVQSYPTVYVLDHEGIIRYRDVRGEEMEQAVNELLAKVPGHSSPPAGSAATAKEAASATEAKPVEGGVPAEEDDPFRED